MFKKTHIHLHLGAGDTPHVAKGKDVHVGDILLKRTKSEIDEFDLAKTLNIPASRVSKILTIKEGDTVTEGQVIAKLKTMVSVHKIKSPVSGEFIWVDQEKGIVGVKRKREDEEMTAWFSGTVEEVGEEKITFGVYGEVIKAKEGKGVPVSGTMLFIADEVTALTMPVDVAESVLVIKKAHSDVVAKADALGVLAIVAEEFEEPLLSLPYAIVETIGDLAGFHAHTVIVSGDEKQLLIIKDQGKK